MRHIPWIIDSVETLVRRNRFELSKIFSFDPADSVYARAEGLMAPSGMVGFALAALKQAMHGAESDRLLLLPYDTPVREPGYAMRMVYAFADLPPFEHDFEDVRFNADEFDVRLGTPGLHSVRRRVGPVADRTTILPPAI